MGKIEIGIWADFYWENWIWKFGKTIDWEMGFGQNLTWENGISTAPYSGPSWKTITISVYFYSYFLTELGVASFRQLF